MRHVDEDLCSLVRTLPCLACGQQPAGEAHHVTTRARGGNDTPENLMPLCQAHHVGGWHQKGARYMIDTYPAVRHWLEAAGRTDVLERAERYR